MIGRCPEEAMRGLARAIRLRHWIPGCASLQTTPVGVSIHDIVHYQLVSDR
jgi:hypothetical protein